MTYPALNFLAQASNIDAPLTWNEALSGILGSISLACWVFFMLPQVYENYRNRSASGVSLAFIGIWLVGDLANFFGAVLASLIPTVVALGAWYLISDATMLLQALHYNVLRPRYARKEEQSRSTTVADSEQGQRAEPDEHAPLLRRNSTEINGTKPVNSATPRRNLSQSISSAPEESRKPAARKATVKNVAAVFAVCLIGTTCWAIAYGVGAWKPTPVKQDGNEVDKSTIAIVLGYISSILYLGARIPQIVKNFRSKSCEGLSLLFFILSLIGNLTYGAQILFHSLERQYILTNLPWLIGSLGTIAEDLTIFAQFHIYREKHPDSDEP